MTDEEQEKEKALDEGLKFNGFQKDFDPDAEHLFEIQTYLIALYLHCMGYSSRAQSNMMGGLLSHTTMLERIRKGRKYFNNLLPIMFDIAQLIKLKQEIGKNPKDITEEDIKRLNSGGK